MTVHLLAGGGTAGHVNPLLAVADRLRERDPASEILVVGTAEGLESRLVPQRGYELVTIPRLPMPRRPSVTALRFPDRLLRTVREVERLLDARGVETVFGVGGYAAAPVYLAARRRRLPLAIHEANSIPGWANRLGARWTRHVGIAFRGTPLRGRGGVSATHVGLPLRPELEPLTAPGARAAVRPAAAAAFGLDPGRPVLLVTGGSSGARRINEQLIAGLDDVLASGWQVLHASGGFRAAIGIERDGYRAVEYLDRMDLALALADLALGRSGTGTVLELSALGVPAVFVPYPHGNGEQRLNAREAVAAGGALLVADEDFTAGWLREQLLPLLGDPSRRSAMAAAIASVGVPDGTARTVALIDAALSERRERGA